MSDQITTSPSGWISVEDRLPERCVRVIVSDGRDVCIAYREDDGDEWFPIDYGYVSVENITHWMPLPDVPQEMK
jgi:hypothetical protein